MNNVDATGTTLIDLAEVGKAEQEDNMNEEGDTTNGAEKTTTYSEYNEEDIIDLTDGQTEIFKVLMAAGINVDNGKAMSSKFDDNLADLYFRLIN